MKPASSLLAKILAWFFLNMFLVAAGLAIFFSFQPYINLHEVFGLQATDRLRAYGLLITHDLSQAPRADWSDILERHASIHDVDFTIVLEDASSFSSANDDLPEPVLAKVRDALRDRPPGNLFPPPNRPGNPRRPPTGGPLEPSGDFQKDDAVIRKPPRHPGEYDDKPHWMMQTRHPSRYWAGLRIYLPHGSAILLAVSDSLTGRGFFFDPLPWVVVATLVMLISMLFWIPMVRNITKPLVRMTGATEKIAEGSFEVTILEPRADEIGRLGRAINHMTSRLSAFVNGQKRFLGDVAHELGSPIARIQFGLGALEQRVKGENQKRVGDVMEDVDHLSKLVNELLAFSRADIKSNTVKLEKTDLLPVVQMAIKRETTSSAKIITKIDPGIQVVASSELLTRAIANLVRNATKYAGSAGPIYISAEKGVDRIEIIVRDNGPGVPDDLLDQLFEPFFRPEASRDRDSGGVGLGLAIVKTCVETCKGTVSAANLQPNGFAVTITLNT